MEEEAEDQRKTLRSLEQTIRVKKKRAGGFRVTNAPRAKSREGQPRTVRSRGMRRFTDIMIRAGECEGAINPVLKTLHLLPSEHGVDTEDGMRLLLRAGYRVEVIKGNGITPVGTVFLRPADLKR